jgi:alanyl-tRNA synthetase
MGSPMTKKLYYKALYRTEFDAAVIRQEKKDGQFHAVLDQTVFYPEGGGQPGDMGRLDEAAVEREIGRASCRERVSNFV